MSVKKYRHSSYCCVPNCYNHEKEGLSFHTFPSHEKLKEKWEKILKLEKPASRFARVCSNHFNQDDFFPGCNKLRRRLKKNAIPSLRLPVIDETSISRTAKKMLKDEVKNYDVGGNAECRACLQVCPEGERYELFKCWEPPWSGMESTVAEDFIKLTNVEICETDKHSKVLCHYCYKMLQKANNFVRLVQDSDKVLKQRYSDDSKNGGEKYWPKPIQIDKAMDNLFENIKIKEEFESEEDSYGHMNGSDFMQDHTKLDIKIEPGEWDEQEPAKINGTISLGELNAEMARMNDLQTQCSKNENNESINGIVNNDKVEFETRELDTEIKDEPLSEEELDENIAPDLPLDCILCMKSFLSISGLKAHVIAQHSYKTVKRKHSDCTSPEKQFQYVCGTCHRRFETSTDLMVHETCHNKCVCYGCNASFDTFELLTEHRRSCKAIAEGNRNSRLVTLEDVKRPNTQRQIELRCPHCTETFTDAYYMDIHLEIHHPASRSTSPPHQEEEHMEIEALEALLGES